VVVKNACLKKNNTYRYIEDITQLLTRKIKFISSSHRVIFFLLYRQEYFCTNNSVKAGNDVTDILASEDMENMPLKSWV